MRRPHPRYDVRRKAWITNAGGRLKVLAQGPKDSQSEAQAWTAFHEHMAHQGCPVVEATTPELTLGELADEYGQWMTRQVGTGEMAEATEAYYRPYIQRFLDAVGGSRVASAILPIELERIKRGWHSVQTIQRLYNWGVKMGLVSKNPFLGIERPEPGGRQRTLARLELAQLLRGTDRPFREFLIALRRTIARPQEIRAVQWNNLIRGPVPMFLLREFKTRRQRKQGRFAVRRIPLDAFMMRMLERFERGRKPSPAAHVFLNRLGRPWTGNAVRCRMRRLRRKVGLGPDINGEEVVAYTLRHTGGSQACVNGVRDKRLAELMGHTRTSTTERYLHLDADHLHEALEQAQRRRAQ